MNIPSLKFLNHASYMIENDDFIFITDPWLEGTAFNDGWRLLDETTSNLVVIDYVKSQNKKIYVWYSHEHSDHFAIPFIKLAKANNIDFQVLFQKSSDRRVFEFLTKVGVKKTLLNNGEEFPLSSDCQIKIWSWKSGDSFSILDLNGFKILNLNDCIVKDDDDLLRIKNLIGVDKKLKVDILFTQFGYASWCGNEDDSEERRVQAQETCKRVASQINTLKPKATILFASYVYFSHEDNFYLNDEQNSPQKIRSSIALSEFQDNIFFMKPNDLINLDQGFMASLQKLTKQAETHWQDLSTYIKPDKSSTQSVDINKIRLAFQIYKNRVERSFLYLFSITELIRFIKPIRIKVNDLNIIVQISYVYGFHFDEFVDKYDASMSSDILLFTLERDYGFDCTHVNGRFRVGKRHGNIKMMYFFGPQNLLKNGFGIKSPIATIKELYRLARRS